MREDLYSILEIKKGATADEIKKAYRTLAKKYHPDINKSPDAISKFKELNRAYEILGDSSKKKTFDHGDYKPQYQDTSHYGTNNSQKDFDDVFHEMFNNNFSGDVDIDIHSEITISFNLSIIGGPYHLRYDNYSFDIKIPPGTKNGEVLRAKGKGKEFGGYIGDLYLTVNVAPSEEYDIDGDNISKKIDIPLKDAWIGGKISVVVPEKEITLKVPKNTKNNQIFRLKEKGLFNKKSKKRGDIYLIANIIVPDIDIFDEKFKKELLSQLD